MAEIFLRKQQIQPGKTDELKSKLNDLRAAAEGDPAGVQSIWEAETLRTLSLFIESTEQGDYLLWYIEADDMEQLIQARAESSHPIHDLEDELMAETLVSPEDVGDTEPLLHAIHPGRSTEYTVELMDRTE
jgi:hypothetical protein